MISEEEFKMLYDKNYYKLFLLAKKILKIDVIAQDIVTDCFIKICECPDLFIVSEDKAGYLYKAVYNKCLDYIKLSNRHDEIIELKGNNESSDDQSAFIEAEFLANIYESIHRLPKKQRQVISFFLNGLSTTEICEALHISQQNVLNQKTNAINRLKQLIHV